MWFRILASEEGSGFLPITADKDAMDMCTFISPRTKSIDMYIVCLSERRVFREDELNKFDEDIDHTRFMNWWIDDIEGGPNSDEEDEDEDLIDEFIPEVMEVVEVNDDDDDDDDDDDGPEAGNGSGPVSGNNGDGPLPAHNDEGLVHGNEDDGLLSAFGVTQTETQRGKKRAVDKGK
ncbi:acidic leucine-rich nuclear phosphoprotein 32 family member B-like [Rosa chinensis]|uniref:acidic leucine-rich nuclear phosphoprotein 32 family member B-like n=1 Tax=Rosa chinensis TaxID=74649 RepID=UPI000D08A9A2|nr:acidic leucine-rich nuclear phosphoprotein 32 family member B-like [Rosa chinensis]